MNTVYKQQSYVNQHEFDRERCSTKSKHTRYGRSDCCRTRTRGGQVQVAWITNSYVQWTLKQNTSDISNPDRVQVARGTVIASSRLRLKQFDALDKVNKALFEAPVLDV